SSSRRGRVPRTSALRSALVQMRSSASRSIRRTLPLSSKPSSLHSVVSRIIGATTLGAAAIAATLGLFFAANARLRAANTDNARATAVSAAAFDLRTHVVELSDALHGVIAQVTPTNLARWHAAERSW